ncbi:MAG: chromosome segregation SMC family protein, partial [Candidatus Micrarchaeia archaeon]
DSVAGISEFEDKKREAMGNLGVVELRLREANLVLGEKIGMLNELEKEREVAIKYNEQRKQFASARGSIIKKEIDRLTSELERAINDYQKVDASLKRKQADMDELDGRIKRSEEEKGGFLREIEARQKQSALTRELEALRLSIGKDEQELEEKKRSVAKLEAEAAQLKAEAKRDSEEAKKKEAELKKAEEEFNSLRPQAEAFAKVMSESRLRKLVSDEKAELGKRREEIIRMEGEIKAAEQLVSEKGRSLDFSTVDNAEKEARLRSEIEILAKEVQGAKAELEALFEQEKESNASIADMERKTLTLREKIAALRAQNPRLASSSIIEFVNQAKEKSSGVHGALVDLISFEAKYALAIEAAAGARLLHIVVSDANIATKMISRIKEAGVGRATFIPLKEIKTSSISASEGLGPLSDFIKYESKIAKAVEYAFGETLLVQSMEEAKKIGLGKYRMVTLDGELFERSGVITGGKMSTGIAAASALAKLDSELSELKALRQAETDGLSQLRERMSSVRNMRAEKEVHMKSLEVELSGMKGEDEKARREKEEAEKRRQEIIELSSRMKSVAAKKGALEEDALALSEKINSDERALQEEEAQLAKQSDEKNRKHTELVAKLSSLDARKAGLSGELELRKTGLRKLEFRQKELGEERNASVSKISELERRLSSQRIELEKKEAELASTSKGLEALFKKMKESEAAIMELGRQRGTLLSEHQKLSREQESLNLKKVTAETKLVDLKAEFDSFRDFVFLDKGKEELTKLMKEAEAFLNQNQAVNLASIELYEKKKAEVGDVRDKMATLDSEKQAIMRMVEEIDSRKKDAFFKTFYAVNDNFKKMFKHIPQVGEGYLYLDKPNEPFESGLHLKLKRGMKEIALESLSGGEKSLVTLMLIFALQFVKPSPYYVLDEVDSALDQQNAKDLAKLITGMSRSSQFILVTHKDTVMTFASAVFGVSRGADGLSKIVGVKLGEKVLEKEDGGNEQKPPNGNQEDAMLNSVSKNQPNQPKLSKP